MKRLLLLFFIGALSPFAVMAQGTPTDDTFTVSDLQQDDEGDWFFTVGLDGSRIYTAYNLDLFLPDGIFFMSEGEGDNKEYYIYMCENTDLYPYTTGKGGKKTFKHQISFQVHGTKQLRLACNSNTNANFTATSGDLFYVYVTVDADAIQSSFSPKPIVKMSGLNLTTSVENVSHKYVPADFACRPFTSGIPTERSLPVNVSAANKVGTLILPFDATLPAGLKAYSCNATEGDVLTLTSSGSLVSCTPYIVYAENGFTGNLEGNAVLRDATNVTDIFADGFLTGVCTATTVSEGYILQNQGSGPKFYDAEGVNFRLPAGRCYLMPTSGSAVRFFDFDFSESTGIESIALYHSEGSCHDLSGRRVNNPVHGVYIKGTHKVIVK